MKTIEGWQIQLKNGKRMEFLSKSDAGAYAAMFGLQPPCKILIK